MDRKMKKLIYLIPLLILTSCYTQKSALEKFGCKLKSDSIRVDTFIREHIYVKTIQGDTVKLWFKSPCDSLGKVKYFKKSIISLTGKLEGDLYSDTTTNTIKADCFEQEYKDSFLTRDSTVKYYESKVMIQPTIEKNFWQKTKDIITGFFTIFGIIAFAILLIYIGLKVIKI